MRTDLALPDAESYGKETLDRIRNNLGADLVVLGSYLAVGDSRQKAIRLDLRLQDAVAGETLVLVTEQGTEASCLISFLVLELACVKNWALAKCRPARARGSELRCHRTPRQFVSTRKAWRNFASSMLRPHGR